MKPLPNPFSLLKTISTSSSSNNPISKNPPHIKKRHLLVHKISSSSPYHTLYKTARPSLFSNPSTFFSSSFDGKEIIIGKKTSPFRITSINPLSHFTRLARKSILQPNQRSLRKSSSSFISTLLNNIRNPNSISTPQHIDETDLKRIYDDFKVLHKQNSTSTKFNPSYNNDMNKIFNMQERTLSKVKQNEREQNKIIQHISKKSKRKAEELLVNRVGSYRIKKELKNELDEEVRKMCSASVYEWQLMLRNDPKRVNVGYLNLGNAYNPKWQMIVKGPNCEEKEFVRNPSKKERGNVKKEIETFFKNSYLKKKVSHKSFCSIDYGKLDLEIKGRDLLEFEQSNSKLIKKKKMMCNNHIHDEMKKAEVYDSNSEPLRNILSHTRNFSL